VPLIDRPIGHATGTTVVREVEPQRRWCGGLGGQSPRRRSPAL